MTDEIPAHLEQSRSSRGFAFLPALLGSYGGNVKVYESSAAEYQRIWLCVTELDDANGPADGPAHDATIHLDADQAWRLSEQLQDLVRNHYQGDATPDWVNP